MASSCSCSMMARVCTSVCPLGDNNSEPNSVSLSSSSSEHPPSTPPSYPAPSRLLLSHSPYCREGREGSVQSGTFSLPLNELLSGDQTWVNNRIHYSYLAEASIQINLQLIRRRSGQSPPEQCEVKGHCSRTQQLHGSYRSYTGAWTTHLLGSSHEATCCPCCPFN